MSAVVGDVCLSVNARECGLKQACSGQRGTDRRADCTSVRMMKCIGGRSVRSRECNFENR